MIIISLTFSFTNLGTRYVALKDVKRDLPDDIIIGRFPMKLFHNKAKCAHCGLTGHLSYRCPGKPDTRKRCFTCGSVSHMRQDCQNEITCNYCAQSGHVTVDCDARKEIRDSRDRPSHDTHEKDRPGTNDVKEPSKPNEPRNTKDDNNLPESSVVTDKHEIIVIEEAGQSTSSSQHTPHNIIRTARAETDCKIDTILLGDSNMKDIDNPSSMLVIAESGASFTYVKKLAELAKKHSDLTHVTSVIMQLGTNDVTKHDGDREELMVNASHAIQSMEELFPNATVGVFSIPPRRGKGNAVSNNNNAANKTNMFLKKYCAKKGSRL